MHNSCPVIHIIYQDEDIVVVHKPARMLIHKSKIDRYETEFLMQRVRDQIGQHVFTVHRLDKPTSGLVILALHTEAAKTLSQAFENKQVSKSYLALCRGYTPEQLHIDYALKEQLDAVTDKQAKQDKAAQSAQTNLQRLATLDIPIPVGRYPGARFSLVKLFPLTGRKHQLRRHMSHIRHPIIGDTTHGDGKQNRFAREHLGFTNLGLCAIELSLEHPRSGEKMTFNTYPEDDFLAIIAQFNIDPESIYQHANQS